MLELGKYPMLGFMRLKQVEVIFRPESCNTSWISPRAGCFACILLPFRLLDIHKGLPFDFSLLEQEDIWGIYFQQIFDSFDFWLGPQTSAIPRDYTHYLPSEGFGIPPLEGLSLVFLPIVISIVDWLPCIFRHFASSSLTTLWGFLSALFEGLS